MALDAAQRNRGVRLRCLVEITLHGRGVKVLDGLFERHATLGVLGILQDGPPGVLRQVLQLSTLSFEPDPVAGDDRLENLLRASQLFPHDSIQWRALTSGRREPCENGEGDNSLPHPVHVSLTPPSRLESPDRACETLVASDFLQLRGRLLVLLDSIPNLIDRWREGSLHRNAVVKCADIPAWYRRVVVVCR